MTRHTQGSSREEHLLRRSQVVPDPGAAPGAWSQYARARVGPRGKVLKPGAGALITVFQRAGFQELTAAARRRFKAVRFLKPAASHARSAGICLLASGLRLV